MNVVARAEPQGCRWCGIPQRGHGRQHADQIGWHSWEQHTQEQVKARMFARRVASDAAPSFAEAAETASWDANHSSTDAGNEVGA